MTAPQVTLTIDGIEVKTLPGKMVLEAANEGGIYIPYLCYHPGLKPFAACRMCVVEVEGSRGYPASCALPVQDGMVVNTTSPGVEGVRRDILELLVAEHPQGCLTCHRVDLCGPQDVCLRHVSVNDRCVTCPKNERCELKDTVRYVGVSLESSLDYKYRGLQIETGDPFYDRDYNLCIVCGRCVRVCEEVRGDNAITFTERAGQALVGTSHGTSLLESGCEFCGACLDVCPVGALTERDNKWEKASRVERTVCPHCPVGCQLNLEVDRNDKVIRVIPELNSPANRGQACYKGKFGLDFVNNKQRLTMPLIRRDGQLVESSWDEALDLVAQRLAGYKGDSVALLAAGDSTNEELYVAQKFARVAMGTNNVDQSTNSCPELVEPLLETVGYAAATNSTWDLEHSRCVVVFNANITEEHNVLALPIKKAVKAGAKLVVIDPREVELTRSASIWLRPTPGTEVLVLGGLLKAIVDGGLMGDDWVGRHCEIPESLLQALNRIDMETLERETGVASSEITEAANDFAAGPSAVVYGLDNVDRERRADCVNALTDLILLTGNLGTPGGGLYPLREGANGQGAWDVGCVPHHLPGYRRTDNSEARQWLEQKWGSPLPESPGLGVREALSAARSGQVKGMLIVGDVPLSTDTEHSDAMASLDALEFLVVQETFLGEAAGRADVVLPRSTFAEKEGTYTSLERRIQLLKPVIAPKDSQAQPESWTLSQLAARMGITGFEFESPAQIMDEIAAVIPQYGGVSHNRIVSEGRWVARPDPQGPAPTQVLYSDKEYAGLQWPCTSPEHSGTATLYGDESGPGRSFRFAVPSFESTAQQANDEYPLMLVPGRVLLQSHRAMAVEKGRANRVDREEIVEIGSQDAESLGIVEGDGLDVVTASGRTRARASVIQGTPPGFVRTTALFGQLAVDLQASKEPDPMARVPRLNVEPARLEKAIEGEAE